MLELVAAIALVLQDPPRPPSGVSPSDYCRTVSDRNIAAGGPGLTCASPTQPLEGPVTLERCLGDREAGRHADCRPLLTPESELVPASLFNASQETPPARLQGWLGVVCGADRLQAGQTWDACEADQRGLHARARLARLALAGRGPSATQPEWASRGSGRFTEAPGEETFDQALAASYATDGTPAAEAAEAPPANGCTRQEDVRRDDAAGTTSARYGVTCNWGSGDPELQRRSRQTLDALMRGN